MTKIEFAHMIMKENLEAFRLTGFPSTIILPSGEPEIGNFCNILSPENKHATSLPLSSADEEIVLDQALSLFIDYWLTCATNATQTIHDYAREYLCSFPSRLYDNHFFRLKNEEALGLSILSDPTDATLKSFQRAIRDLEKIKGLSIVNPSQIKDTDSSTSHSNRAIKRSFLDLCVSHWIADGQFPYLSLLIARKNQLQVTSGRSESTALYEAYRAEIERLANLVIAFAEFFNKSDPFRNTETMLVARNLSVSFLANMKLECSFRFLWACTLAASFRDHNIPVESIVEYPYLSKLMSPVIPQNYPEAITTRFVAPHDFWKYELEIARQLAPASPVNNFQYRSYLRYRMLCNFSTALCGLCIARIQHQGIPSFYELESPDFVYIAQFFWSVINKNHFETLFNNLRGYVAADRSDQVSFSKDVEFLIRYLSLTEPDTNHPKGSTLDPLYHLRKK